MEGAKSCTICGEVKSLSQFVRSAKRKDGRGSLCLDCKRKDSKAYHQSETFRARVQNDPVTWKLKQLLFGSKSRARDLGIDHNIDLDYLREILPPRCPYLQVEFSWEIKVGSGHRKTHPNSPSIDRIDSSQGYVKGNVAIVSHRANAIKNNATEQELLDIARAVSFLKAELAFPG